MAIEIHLSPTQAFSVFLATPKVQRTQNLRPISVGQFKIKTSTTRETPTGFRPRFTIKAANQSSAVVDGSQEPAALPDHRTIPAIKTALNQSLQGINRGIFGVPSAKKSEIEGLVNLLESQNPAQNPTDNLVKVDGRWKLVYSTISILGIKRTKLGLRDFVSLGNFLQIIDVAQGKAVNVINFHVRGLTLLTGQLRIEASFKIASKTRVDIKYMSSTINPDQLLNLFKKNYDLLLAIFNPEGWLEISYVDESMRIGRDDKGNIFVLERDE